MNMMERVRAYKVREVEEDKLCRSRADMRATIADVGEPRGFAAHLQRQHDSERPALIAEIKKRSPSAGLVREDFDVKSIAREYQAGGAACLSVLADRTSFDGDDEHIRTARQATTLPVLYKDFLLDPHQVVRGRAAGADAVLIILALVDDACARSLEDQAGELGMDVLLEVHDERELERALALRSPLLGINNRDLTTLTTSLATAEALAPLVPAGYTIVGESGLRERADLERLIAVGVHTFLVGESLLRQPDVASATRRLLNG